MEFILWRSYIHPDFRTGVKKEKVSDERGLKNGCPVGKIGACL